MTTRAQQDSIIRELYELFERYGAKWSARLTTSDSYGDRLEVWDQGDLIVTRGSSRIWVLDVTENSLEQRGYKPKPVTPTNPDGDALMRLVKDSPN